jgi:hypothetical protein
MAFNTFADGCKIAAFMGGAIMDEKHFECSECGASFSTREALRAHVYRHINEERPQADTDKSGKSRKSGPDESR